MRLLLVLFAWLAVAAPAAAETRVDFAAVVAQIEAGADKALAAYDPADGFETSDAFSGLYFDVFEASGMEAAVGAASASRKTELEARFGTVIGLSGKGAAPAEVAAAWESLRQLLRQTAQEQADAAGGSFAAFLQAFLILLREGFEAMLVVGALVAYLRRLGAADRLNVVYGGVGIALVASIAAAWVMSEVIKLSGQGREAVEGVTMLIAAAVLAWVSHWLFAKREAAKWQGYVKAQIERAVSSGQAFSLGFAAFLAVFREGAETVLFYQALLAGAPGEEIAVFAGFMGGAVALGGVYVLMRVMSVRLPLGLFFGGTAVLLYALAVIFAGNGVLELQEARWIEPTPLAGIPTIPWLGVFPTVETLSAQGVLLLMLFPVLGVWARRRQGRSEVG
jgi:high-affinity iron transporter